MQIIVEARPFQCTKANGKEVNTLNGNEMNEMNEMNERKSSQEAIESGEYLFVCILLYVYVKDRQR